MRSLRCATASNHWVHNIAHAAHWLALSLAASPKTLSMVTSLDMLSKVLASGFRPESPGSLVSTPFPVTGPESAADAEPLCAALNPAQRDHRQRSAGQRACSGLNL